MIRGEAFFPLAQCAVAYSCQFGKGHRLGARRNGMSDGDVPDWPAEIGL